MEICPNAPILFYIFIYSIKYIFLSYIYALCFEILTKYIDILIFLGIN